MQVRLARGRGISYVKYELVRTYVAVVADVTVNRTTGAIKVDRVFAVHDCGQIINPDGLRNQIEGNIVQTVSRTLIEKGDFQPKRRHQSQLGKLPDSDVSQCTRCRHRFDRSAQRSPLGCRRTHDGRCACGDRECRVRRDRSAAEISPVQTCPGAGGIESRETRIATEELHADIGQRNWKITSRQLFAARTWRSMATKTKFWR